MKNLLLTRYYFRPNLEKTKRLFYEYWFTGALVLIGLNLLVNKDINIQFSLIDTAANITAMANPSLNNKQAPESAGLVAVPTNWKKEAATSSQKTNEKTKTKTKKWSDRKANTFSNLTFVLSPTYAERHNINPSIAKEKVNNCKSYAEKYAPVALKEKKEYGIPVSITLAQGILESNAGDSRLSLESNNHFGIKCRSKCRGCTCRNYTDDDVYDMFRVFDSVWDSYREHSKLLTTRRYKHLLKLDQKDYKKWAHGLKKAGYATDKRYAEKLIQIIEFLELDKYDQ